MSILNDTLSVCSFRSLSLMHVDRIYTSSNRGVLKTDFVA